MERDSALGRRKDSRLYVWETAGGKRLLTATGVDQVSSLVFSRDNRWLAVAGEQLAVLRLPAPSPR